MSLGRAFSTSQSTGMYSKCTNYEPLHREADILLLNNLYLKLANPFFAFELN